MNRNEFQEIMENDEIGGSMLPDLNACNALMGLNILHGSSN